MKRVRLTQDIVEKLEGLANPGETVQQTLDRILEIRYRETAYPGRAGLTYKELAERWGCFKSDGTPDSGMVKKRVKLYRDTAGKAGLGPVMKLGARKVLVPWHAIEAYEKHGSW